MMRIAGTQYTLSAKALEIFVAGCGGQHCKDCHNPELWDFNQGAQYNLEFVRAVIDKIHLFPRMIENIMVMGGEPLDQEIGELVHLLMHLRGWGVSIWLFTRYEFYQISPRVVELCDYIKTGKYIPELRTEGNVQYGITLATSNQRILKRGVDYGYQSVHHSDTDPTRVY